MNNLHQIKTEIKSLSKHIQAINEIDGLLWKSNEILNSFTILDWKSLLSDKKLLKVNYAIHLEA